MATIDIIVPEMGESVRTGVVAKWHKADGDVVKRDEVIMDLETDKVTAEIAAPAAGRLKQMAKVGQTVAVQSVVGQVDESAAGAAPAASPAPTALAASGAKDGAGAKSAAKGTTLAPAAPATPAVPAPGAAKAPTAAAASVDVRSTPLAKKLAEEHGVDLSHIEGTGAGGRIREQDVLAFVQSKNNGSHAAAGPSGTASAAALATSDGPAKRERLSPLRMRIAQRLVEAKNTAAMLTTFNEVDMTAVMELRKKYKEEFEKINAVGLGFMSFFVKAVVAALKQVPTVNAYLVPAADGALEVEFHESADIAVAVSTPKGLTVPVLRGCQHLSFAQIEQGIKALAVKARDGKLALEDLQGGTFTITNGGIFGSLLSTPILNPPQTAILGMHAIKNRPVEDPDRPGQIALRPMMYLALSYDHRLLDGAQAVTFLVAIKNALEKPERMLIGI